MFDPQKYGSDQNVVFEIGVHRDLLRHIDDLGVKRVLILTTPQQSSLGLDLAAQLGTRTAGVFCRAAMHTPVSVTEEAVAHLNEVGADAVLSAGGGSTIGLGKALALRTGVTQIALPTTYAGSECTPILGQTENGVKTTMRDEKLRPAMVLYDPELVATLPIPMTVTSALNAMAHSVEGLYARDRTPEATELALFSLRAFQASLPRVLETPTDLEARLETQKGAWACGTVLGQVGMALHHKLCHTLGGTLDLPHAETHAIVLPHAIAYNSASVPETLAPVAEIFGSTDPALALWEFARDMGAPLALKDLGIGPEDLDRVADLAVQNPYWNPREITRPGIRDLLERAWEGQAPAA
ncbi:maleylacetate reductase [Arenibacterium sp. LLYu02]|uniref:maleylacetate reductase n=1 Tax=Arenibacterium sp. LLYu02 TaxID=3404132 RepID=UPI003B20E061